MTKKQMIEQIHKLRRKGDPFIPLEKKAMEQRLKDLQERARKEAQ